MMRALRSTVIVALAAGTVSAGASQRQAPHPGASGPVATIAGTLRDYRSEPIAGAHIQLATIDLRPVHDATTDADGGFTMTLVSPGLYAVRLIGRDHVVHLQTVRVTGGRTIPLRMLKGVVLHGRVTDERRAPVGGVPVCGLQQINAAGAPLRYRSTDQATTDADGRFVIHNVTVQSGDFLVGAFPSGCLPTLSSQPMPARLARYPPSFAPSTHDIARATVFQLDARSEPPEMSIAMTPGAVTRLAGRVPGYVNTTVIPGRVILEPPDGPAAVMRFARLSSDGGFVFPAVPPGEYRLSVTPHVDAKAPPTWASTTVVVKGAPTQQVTLQLQPTTVIAGSASFDGHPSPLYGVKVFSHITASPTGGNVIPSRMINGQSSAVDADGQFLIKGLVPGEYRLSASGYVSLGWTVVSATLPTGSGELERPDALDVPFTIAPGQSLFGVKIKLTIAPGAIAGTVTDRENRPAAGATVLAFSTDSSYWRPGSRRIITARTGDDGAFETGFVPDGEYFVVTGQERPDLNTLASRSQGATRVTVTTGPPIRVSLRLNTGSDSSVTKR